MTNKIVLTVDSQYVDWGITQGIREIIQNGIDADTKGHKLSIHYDTKKMTLVVTNKNISIPKSSLLIGYSTKKGDNTQIGEFGEGYKLGCMALLKRGLEVEIRTGAESWRPILEYNTAFEREVLAFNIEQAEHSSDISFIIHNLSARDWEDTKPLFLMFDDRRKYTTFCTPYGDVLVGPDYKGRIYVGGILIEQITDEKFEFGYNLKPGEMSVDRDRRMSDRWKLKSVSVRCLSYLAKQEEKFFELLEECLIKGTADVKDAYFNLPEEISRDLQERFINKYGDDFIPVESESDVVQVGHYGKRGKVFSESYVQIISKRTGNIFDLKRKYDKQVQKEIPVNKLPKRQQKNFEKAVEMIGRGCPNLPTIVIGELVKGGALGLYKSSTDTVTLNKNILKDFGETLAVLVHEVGHRAGGDGSKEHHDEMQRIWVAIVTSKKKRKVRLTPLT